MVLFKCSDLFLPLLPALLRFVCCSRFRLLHQIESVQVFPVYDFVISRFPNELPYALDVRPVDSVGGSWGEDVLLQRLRFSLLALAVFILLKQSFAYPHGYLIPWPASSGCAFGVITARTLIAFWRVQLRNRNKPRASIASHLPSRNPKAAFNYYMLEPFCFADVSFVHVRDVFRPSFLPLPLTQKPIGANQWLSTLFSMRPQT